VGEWGRLTIGGEAKVVATMGCDPFNFIDSLVDTHREEIIKFWLVGLEMRVLQKAGEESVKGNSVLRKEE